MATVALIALPDAVSQRIESALGSLATVRRIDDPETLSSVDAALAVVGVGVGDDPLEIPRLVRAAARDLRMTVYAPSISSEQAVACMRLGVIDILSDADDVTTIRARLENDLQRDREVASEGGVAVLMAPRGGRPWSAVVSELASLAARRGTWERGVVLLDLEGAGSDLDLRLDLRPSYSVQDAVADMARLDSALLKGVLAIDKRTGLHYMPLGGEAEESRAELHLRAGMVVDVLAGIYDLVLVFMPGAACQERLRNTINAASRRLVLCDQDLGNIRLAKAAVEKIEIGVPAEETVAVIYEQDGKISLNPKRVAESIGIAEAVVLPNADAALIEAGNAGEPMALAGRRRQNFLQGLDILARHLPAVARQGGKPAGRRGFSLFGRNRVTA
ncbi:MAG: hypothetical protein RLO50_09455 [Azospirillaceae bacterium]